MDQHSKIANGVFMTDKAPSVLVESEAKLSALAGAQPGTIAYTAGFASMWMLDTDGTTWVAFNNGSEE